MIRKPRQRRLPAVLAKIESEDWQTSHLGTFGTRAAAEKHERAVQYFKRQG